MLGEEHTPRFTFFSLVAVGDVVGAHLFAVFVGAISVAVVSTGVRISTAASAAHFGTYNPVVAVAAASTWSSAGS